MQKLERNLQLVAKIKKSVKSEIMSLDVIREDILRKNRTGEDIEEERTTEEYRKKPEDLVKAYLQEIGKRLGEDRR